MLFDLGVQSTTTKDGGGEKINTITIKKKKYKI